jgi:hypothetical protein
MDSEPDVRFDRFGQCIHNVARFSSRSRPPPLTVRFSSQRDLRSCTNNLTSRIAASLAPDDPEISFNLAAVLEACVYSIILRTTVALIIN